MGVKITKVVNGILFDTTGLPGSGQKFAKKKFIPKDFGNINDVLLYDDRVVATDTTGTTYVLNLTGSENAYPISHIEGNPVTTIEDTFDQFITIL